MRWNAVAVLALAATAAAPLTQVAPERHWNMASPDGRTELFIDRQEDGRLTWRLTRDRQVVLADSPLGIRRADQTFDARPLAGRLYRRTHARRALLDAATASAKTITSSRASGRCTFANPAGAKLDLIVRMQNDGAAFRYRFPGHRRRTHDRRRGADRLSRAPGIDGVDDAAAGRRQVRPGLRGPLPGSAVRDGVGAARRLGLPCSLQDRRRQVGADHGVRARRDLLRLAPRAERPGRRVSDQVP